MPEPIDLSATRDFLSRLRKNNNHAWFEENRAHYDAARDELERLVAALLEDLGSVADLGDLTPRDCIMRIHRDTRFSRNKAPYKTGFGARIVPGGRRTGRVGYYVHLEPGNVMVGGGLWEPTSHQLARFREVVGRDPTLLREIVAEEGFQRHFGGIFGATLKTAPRGWPANHPDIDLLRYKQVCAIEQLGDIEVPSQRLAAAMAAGLRAMTPFIRFLNGVIA